MMRRFSCLADGVEFVYDGITFNKVPQMSLKIKSLQFMINAISTNDPREWSDWQPPTHGACFFHPSSEVMVVS